ncbi:hypothetical protein BN77_2770 [Rhizobium mesoamericanum STM3625]|uniref:Uncharacterized protein n=1 Tax=Rhizobium mesoamericanum STM3625 TaxID=1211777 RepID=K0PWF2_9HYPH|nr:hypothetical protein BN77_2770 [Rhizobium mesoamericanum STM3625]
MVATGLEIIEWLLLLLLLLLGVDQSGADCGAPGGTAHPSDIGIMSGTLAASKGCYER